MTQPIELFYDFRSPYSYLAFTQLREMDVDIAFRPMKILKVMEKVGNVPTTITCAAKGRYARVDLGRWAQRYGVTLNPSNMRENDGDACSRAVLAATSPRTLKRSRWCSTAHAGARGRRSRRRTTSSPRSPRPGIDAAPIADRIDAPEVDRAARRQYR